MKIIKRNGSEAVFDITKIIAAITKANKVVPDAQRLTKQQIIEISDHVQEVCYARGHAMNVEEIQDIVEDAIMATGAYEVARRYITYRYVQSLKRTHNTTDDKILPSSSATTRKSSRRTPTRTLPSTAYSVIYGRRGQQGSDHAYAAPPGDRQGA